MESNDILPVDTQMILHESKSAIEAVRKNSKLRAHYLKLVMMTNIMRAFVVMYELDEEYKIQQLALLKVVTDVEGRKNRLWLKGDLVVLDRSYVLFDELLGNATQEQMLEVMQMVESNWNEGKYVLSQYKDGRNLRNIRGKPVSTSSRPRQAR